MRWKSRRSSSRDSYWGEYVSVGERREAAQGEIAKLRKEGKLILPVIIQGRTIASSFWGKNWCSHLEKFSDYENRLPRGRTYARNGSVIHLEILPGRIEAIVSGSSIYKISIEVAPIKKPAWEALRGRCAGGIGSMLDLLRGRLSDGVMGVVCDQKDGLFPQPGEMKLGCSCPDWADMCKHVAAVLYGVGARLDATPELVFKLRGVDPSELISGAGLAIPAAPGADADALGGTDLAALFGIELEPAQAAPVRSAKAKATAKTTEPMKAVKAAHVARLQEAAKAASITKAAKNAKAPGSSKRPTSATPAPAAKSAATNMKSDSKKKSESKDKAFNPILGNPPTGEQVRRLRLTANLGVAAFARKLGVSAAVVYGWERKSESLNLQTKSLVELLLFEKNLPGK